MEISIGPARLVKLDPSSSNNGGFARAVFPDIITAQTAARAADRIADFFILITVWFNGYY
jgi:hypothetical protein